ncbi:MAG: mechanosensitive ion channel family protein [Rubricoccaceae bacterium]
MLLAGGTSAFSQTAESVASPIPDSALAVAVQGDSLSASSFTRGDSVEVLSDSAGRQLDSAAVAALADTTVLPATFGEGVGVTLFGKTLFRAWGGLGSFTPEERALRLTERLESLASNPDIDPDSIRVVDGNELTTLQLGDVIVMTVTDADADAQLMSRTSASLEYLRIIREEIERHREQLTLKGLTSSAIKALLALILMMLTLRSLRWVSGWLAHRTAPVRRQLVRPVRVGTIELVSRDQVARAGRALASVARWSTGLVVIYLFLTYIFGLFPWTQSWSEGLLAYALAPLKRLGALVLDAAPNVLAIAVIVVLVRWLIGVSNFIFARVEQGELALGRFHPELAEPTRQIAKFLLVILAIMLIYPYTFIAGSPVFQGLTLFLGILFSLGSSSAISNVVAGTVLTYTRAFRVGDRVKVGDTFGDVVEKSFLTTRIRTPKNEDVSVPNSTVLSGHIVNYSVMAREGSGVILHTTVTIGYDVPWPRVYELLVQAALETDGIEPEPAPFVLQTSLGDFSVAYQLNAYTVHVKRMATLYSTIHQNIQTQFALAGIEILSPTYHARRDAPSTVPPSEALYGVHQPDVHGLTDGADLGPIQEVPAVDGPVVDETALDLDEAPDPGPPPIHARPPSE